MTAFDFSNNTRRLLFEREQADADLRSARRYLREGALSTIQRLEAQRRSIQMMRLDKR